MFVLLTTNTEGRPLFSILFSRVLATRLVLFWGGEFLKMLRFFIKKFHINFLISFQFVFVDEKSVKNLLQNPNCLDETLNCIAHSAKVSLGLTPFTYHNSSVVDQNMERMKNIPAEKAEMHIFL